MNETLLISVLVVLVVAVLVIGPLYLTRYVGVRLHRVVAAAMKQALDADAADIGRQMVRIARDETAVYVMQHLPKVPAFPNRFALLDHSTSRNLMEWMD